MRSTRSPVQTGSWWWSGVAALSLHGALVWALPSDASAPRPVHSVPELAWMSVSDAAAVPAAPRGDAAGAAPKLTTSSKRARARKASAPSAQSAHLPEAAASEAGLVLAAAGREPDLTAAGVPSDGTAEFDSVAGAGLAGGAGGAQGSGDALAASVRGPGLLARTNPCEGFFPASAAADEGQVHIHVEVGADGRPRTSDLLVELPAGQGFGHAARACAAGLRFSPALDQRGLPVAGRAKLALRFRRS